MENATGRVSCPREVNEVDRSRAQIYQLLGSLLSQAPSTELAKGIASLQGDDTEVGQAFSTLSRLASRLDSSQVEREYHHLFIGLGRGELLPYASYYLTGFLNEKPLADLRTDLSQRGIKGISDVKEPEDHMGTLCEVMAAIITGQFDGDSSDASQKEFFEAHLKSWAELFFTDLEAAESAVFYAPVGALGKAFMAVESQAFGMQ